MIEIVGWKIIWVCQVGMTERGHMYTRSIWWCTVYVDKVQNRETEETRKITIC